MIHKIYIYIKLISTRNALKSLAATHHALVIYSTDSSMKL